MSASAPVRYEVRYRVDGTVQWGKATTFAPSDEIVISGLAQGKTYNVQARAISSCGAVSAWADQSDLVVPDANQRISQGNLSAVTVGGIRSAWVGLSVSYTATTTTATISTTAATLQDGASNPTYGAATVPVTGVAGTTVVYYLYFDDPTGAGGSLALGATTNYDDLSANQSRVWVGQVSVVYPATGTGSGGGSSGGGGPCVGVDMWVLVVDADGQARPLRAGEVQCGDRLLGADPATLDPRTLTVAYSAPRIAACTHVAAGGARVLVSLAAPIAAPDQLVLADLIGARREIWVRTEAQTCAVDASSEPAGMHIVQHIAAPIARPTPRGGCFWVSADRRTWILHHNLKAISP